MLRFIVSLERFYNDYTPLFRPLLCAICIQVIRGSYFECLEKHCTKNRACSICQDCQNASEHQHHNLRKRYKHCILTESIDASTSHKICKCGTVPRHDTKGRSRSLYPVHATDKHRSTPKGTVQCGLLDLTSLVAEAKFENVVLKVDKRSTLEEEKRLAHEEAKHREQKKAANQYPRQTATETVDEKEAGEDIPFFMRRITDRYPFGNVHMALRVGPIIIENGVQHSKGGAIITSRDPPIWQSSGGSDRSIAYALALSEDRSLYSQVRDQRKPKRYKTALKQVVGGLFGGFSSQDLEAEVIDLVIAGSQKILDDEDESPRNNKKLLNSVLEPIIQRLSTLMKTRVDIMLQSITRRLLDTSVKLHWDQKANNCQNFCDSLIDFKIYGGFLSDSSEMNPLGVDPLYLMSFVCRPESYLRERRVRTKFDVPSGLCEEYLLKFRYGFHVDSDIIDMLQEYWYDWGAFGSPLYRYQRLFPWDCTEAYGRSSTKCNDCNISKHVWSFPFDSWSIAELHLTRGRLMYPDITSEQEWMENRMMVILAQTTLVTAAKTMAESITFRNATSWIAKHTDPRMDRMKLGGIHRAQPFSHQYENGKYHEYFIADWAHLQREDQIAEYEDIREARRQLPDVPETSGGYGSSLRGSYSQSSSYDYDGMGWAMFGPYYDSGWDGTYDQNETLTPDQLALIGTDDDGSADAGGDSGGDGGDGGGGYGGDSGGGAYGGDSGGGC